MKHVVVYRKDGFDSVISLGTKYATLHIDIYGNPAYWIIEGMKKGDLWFKLAPWNLPREDFGKLMINIIKKSKVWNSPVAHKDLACSGRFFLKSHLYWPDYRGKRLNFCYDGSFTKSGRYELFCITDTWMSIKAEKELILNQKSKVITMANKWTTIWKNVGFYNSPAPVEQQVAGVEA